MLFVEILFAAPNPSAPVPDVASELMPMSRLVELKRGEAGRAVVVRNTVGMMAQSSATWEAYEAVLARMATLGAERPVALASQADRDAANAAHGG